MNVLLMPIEKMPRFCGANACLQIAGQRADKRENFSRGQKKRIENEPVINLFIPRLVCVYVPGTVSITR